ncbi:hypothetical protein BD410DRAFT_787859 [Rickenella mellea]|uniref:Uncharacterized protein n=1 Tax=Rickenella mellea TaxID=50990 RepID=A0A4Y7Q7C6_9AGAM|nr:hypothetical protein BD410DRAFT_787859 [Rickenella mellea]
MKRCQGCANHKLVGNSAIKSESLLIWRWDVQPVGRPRRTKHSDLGQHTQGHGCKGSTQSNASILLGNANYSDSAQIGNCKTYRAPQHPTRNTLNSKA